MESLYNGELGFGLLILFVHDASDVMLDLMKMCNYLKLEGTHGLYLTEIAFVLNTYVCWPYFRLYYFPFVAIPTTLLRHNSLCPGQQKKIGLTMLCLLVVLHLFWWNVMNRIAFKMVKGGSPNRAGEEEYEQTRTDLKSD